MQPLQRWRIQNLKKKYDPSQCVNCSEYGRCKECKKCKECPYCKDLKSCKCLGSMIDTALTAADIKRRKSLCIDALNKLKNVWKNNRVSTQVKRKIVNAFIASIFSYNSELWSLNSYKEGMVDVFHRRMLRKMLNVTWPKKMSNEKVNNIT